MPKTACCSSLILSPVLLKKAHSIRSLQQFVEPAGLVESGQVVVAPDVGAADIDLRDGAAPRFVHHLDAPCGLEVDTDLVDHRHPLPAQQALRHPAERAE